MDRGKALDAMTTGVAELDKGKKKVGVTHSYSEWDYLKSGESKYNQVSGRLPSLLSSSGRSSLPD